jgi:hypothetical protein
LICRTRFLKNHAYELEKPGLSWVV